MPADEASLTRLRRWEDRGIGLSEEFLQPTLGGGRTVAVLSRPLERSHPLGWVICHPYGIEQIHLGRLDVIVSRALAAGGFPVLRFHGQGYGDSEQGMDRVGLSSHLADAIDAVALLRRQEGIDRVGVLGARFGGTVAALVGDRENLAAMGLWDPIVSGEAYGRELLRRKAISEMVRSGDDAVATGVKDLRRKLEARGMIELNGFPLSMQAFEEISSIDLLEELSRFTGASLLLSVSRADRVGARLKALFEHLQALTGRCSLAIVQDKFAGEFGKFHYRTDPGSGVRRDTLFPISRGIAAQALEWSRSLVEVPAPGFADLSEPPGVEVSAGGTG